MSTCELLPHLTSPQLLLKQEGERKKTGERKGEAKQRDENSARRIFLSEGRQRTVKRIQRGRRGGRTKKKSDTDGVIKGGGAERVTRRRMESDVSAVSAGEVEVRT